MLLYYFTLIIVFIGNAGAKTRIVTLTTQRESLVIYGGKLTDYPLLAVEAECPDNECRVLVEFAITNIKNTTFTLFSQDGLYTYAHETIAPVFNLSTPVSFLSDSKSDPNFVVSFRLWRGNEVGWLPTVLTPVNENGTGLVELDGAKTRATTLALERHDHPVLKILIPQVSEGCAMHVYAGGLPSAESIANSDTLLFKFDGSAPFQNSFLKNEVITVWVPENCTASLKYHAIKPETLEVGTFKPSVGVLTSYEWKDPFADTALYNESLDFYLLGDEGEPNRTIYLVVQTNPSSDGFLWIELATASGNPIWEANITTTESFTCRAHGQSLSAKWQPGFEEISQGFSIFYWIVDGDEPIHSSTHSSRIPSTTTMKTTESASTTDDRETDGEISEKTTIPTIVTKATGKTVPTTIHPKTTTTLKTSAAHKKQANHNLLSTMICILILVFIN
ncbi:unnamed protein product, partial [Mesorhabditis belari]|uniref:Uncharacterized protein n=1 Tax=Mesorhabditis belari TaxID=2138241 RepID=A0AAF3E8G2_9BILA